MHVYTIFLLHNAAVPVQVLIHLSSIKLSIYQRSPLLSKYPLEIPPPPNFILSRSGSNFCKVTFTQLHINYLQLVDKYRRVRRTNGKIPGSDTADNNSTCTVIATSIGQKIPSNNAVCTNTAQWQSTLVFACRNASNHEWVIRFASQKFEQLPVYV